METREKEKEREDKLKELRQEIEEKMLAEIPEEGLVPTLHVKVEKLDEALAVDEKTAKRIIEALLFASSKPVTVAEIKKVLRGLKPSGIEQMIRDLAAEYEGENRSFRIQEIAGGFEVGTDPKYAPWIMKLEMQKRARQASHSALETLAIIAYKQPVTRAEVEDLRGVDIASVLAALLEKNLIKIVGRKEVPGRPFLYGTTEKFLEHFGLKALSDLPQVGEIRELVEKALPREKFLNPKQEESQPKTESTENPDVQASESPDTVPGPVETSPEDRPA
ncbi:MAG: SMC-Scp complex subunit ScpB [Candidatus Omnitrophica bacterium]|nr:SMC-Scp complex subunit ScpB [Candidatus Omnitrophota bacterium]